jgi:hypothetical protein
MGVLLPVNDIFLMENTTYFLNDLIRKGGPEIHDYEKFTCMVDNLSPSEINPFREKDQERMFMSFLIIIKAKIILVLI